MPKCVPGSCKLVLYSFTVLPAAGFARATLQKIKAGILCLVPEVVPPAPNNISALMVPASDFISRCFLRSLLHVSFGARFHCRSRLQSDPIDGTPALLSADHDFSSETFIPVVQSMNHGVEP